jgi:hypothetical protein
LLLLLLQLSPLLWSRALLLLVLSMLAPDFNAQVCAPGTTAAAAALLAEPLPAPAIAASSSAAALSV